MSSVTSPPVVPAVTAMDEIVAPPPQRRRRLFRGGASGLLIALPAVLLFAMFSWWPILRGLVLSFQKTNLIDTSWVGIENFQRVLADPLLGQALANTALYAALALLIGFPIPIFFAVLIAEMRRSRQISSVLVFLPVVIPPVVSILLWQVFYDPSSRGLFNTVLATVGIGPLPWLQSPSTAMLSIVLVATWGAFGSTTIIYLATLLSIDTQLYEAAEIDGAGILRRIWHITLPQMRGTILLLLLLQLIGTFQVFTEPFLLTGGGPNNSTVTLLMLIYRYAFIYGNFGQAAALSLMLAVGLSLFAAVYLWLSRKWSKR
ncbi:multiple sugar transport system permease protein [Microbacterium terrae]|uniref:L-arabinose transport system permease protein AraP n=1 Tax=Microbacterium terrae TaxID=69369 RepID=A0A0M2H322_9MICO|nr:sugar ABC transporter permease [Microbacterium terrae]KJL38683.1 L-arabinose transport system permease protein AraP [Microbacterium terrae]MBP1076102.1 multiple sugar transport system permease protein [Microbacterium terrae]GLJ96922.1 sugar ABC transporter permease [Microbacterium terrae]